MDYLQWFVPCKEVFYDHACFIGQGFYEKSNYLVNEYKYACRHLNGMKLYRAVRCAQL